MLPAVGLADALDHPVAFVTAPAFRPLLESWGQPWLGGTDAFAVGAWHDPHAAASRCRTIRGVCASWKPDVIVASALELGALLAAEQEGIGVAVLGLMGDLPPIEQRDELAAAHRAARREVGLAPRPVDRMRGDVYLRRSIPALADDASPGTVFVGACLWEPPPSRRVLDWIGAGSLPIVYAHPARTFGGRGFWPELCALRGVRVAASISRMDVARTTSPPGGLVGPLVPQQALLAVARAVVCSGTTTVALGALTHGVPVTVLPGGTEQGAIADTLVRAGCAVRLDVEALTVDALQASVDALCEAGPHRERAAELAVQFARHPGFDIARKAVGRLA